MSLIHVNEPKVKGTVSSSAVLVTLPTNRSSSVRIGNAATDVIFFKFGDSTVTATSDDNFMLPGTESFSKNPGDTHVSIISPTATGDVYFQCSGGGE